MFAVLNKTEEYNKLERSTFNKVIAHCKSDFQIQQIYPLCTFGYEPGTCLDTPLNIRGVDQLREELKDFLASHSEGKEILLARFMGEKRPFLVKIITVTSCLVAAAAFAPSSAILSATLQAAGICQLYYLYKGRVISAT